MGEEKIINKFGARWWSALNCKIVNPLVIPRGKNIYGSVVNNNTTRKGEVGEKQMNFSYFQPPPYSGRGLLVLLKWQVVCFMLLVWLLEIKN